NGYRAIGSAAYGHWRRTHQTNCDRRVGIFHVDDHHSVTWVVFVTTDADYALEGWRGTSRDPGDLRSTHKCCPGDPVKRPLKDISSFSGDIDGYSTCCTARTHRTYNSRCDWCTHCT